MKKRSRVKMGTAMLLSAVCLVILGMSVFADVTKEEAGKIARERVPSSYKLNEEKYEAGEQEWEFEFYSKDKKTEYEVHIDVHTGKVKKKDMEKRFEKGGRCVRISPGCAKKAVRKKFKGCKVKSVKKKKEDGRYFYKVKFRWKGNSGEAKVSTGTGRLIGWTVIYS